MNFQGLRNENPSFYYYYFFFLVTTVLGFELGLLAGEEPETVSAGGDGDGEAVRSEGFTKRGTNSLKNDSGHFFD